MGGLSDGAGSGKPSCLTMDADFCTGHINLDVTPVCPVAGDDVAHRIDTDKPLLASAFYCADPDQLNFLWIEKGP